MPNRARQPRGKECWELQVPFDGAPLLKETKNVDLRDVLILKYCEAKENTNLVL